MKKYIVIAAVCIVVSQRAKLPKGTVKDEGYFGDELQDLVKRKFIEEYTGKVETPAAPATGEETPPPPPPAIPTAEEAKAALLKKTRAELVTIATEKGLTVALEAVKADIADQILNAQ